MLKIMLFGCNGYMGTEVAKLAQKDSECELVCGVDREIKPQSYKTVTSPEQFKGDVDVIIDFSHHTAIKDILPYAIANKIPAVLCTTGYTDEELELIEEASKSIAIFKSANMSLGINLASKIAKIATMVLQGYDVEIIEKHHNRKLDAPSGTAMMLFNSVKDGNNELYPVFDRSQRREKRDPNEVGISALRGGNIVGEHEVFFVSENEVVSIKHEAFSRAVFADGAIKASKFLKDKCIGMFDMNNVL